MKPWHALQIEEIFSLLKQAEPHVTQNSLPSESYPRWHIIFFRQFKSILVLILMLAAVLSYFIGDRIDAAAIIIILFVNACLGFAQEWKAESALQNLKNLLSPRCRVLRENIEQEISAADLRKGDIVLLATGDVIPADLRLIQTTNLSIDESVLTGEAGGISKGIDTLPANCPLSARSNMGFMGTYVVNGHAQGVAVAIGAESEFGQIAELTKSVKEAQTHLSSHLDKLGRQFGFFAIMSALFVILYGLWEGHALTQMAMTGISLAVAAIPEGLPAAVTITLAIGMATMARKKALLRNLQAAETLGAVSVICTDKTGTLTKNEMTVEKIWLASGEISVSGNGYEPAGEFFSQDVAFAAKSRPDLINFLETARICNVASIKNDDGVWKAIGSPTEAALITLAEKARLNPQSPPIIIAEHSFSSDRKKMSIVEERGSARIAHVKGAPECLLPACSHILLNGALIPLTPEWSAAIKDATRIYACEGLRILGMAQKLLPADMPPSQENCENGLVFLGLATFTDPPRAEVKDAVQAAIAAGIRIIMITGDAPDTAMAIANKVGLPVTRVITGSALSELSDADLSEYLMEDVLFARTVPVDKFRIVKLLQAQHQLVAMTGDGVNDAPALKQADIGIAMGIRSTDVAKGAADIVLLDDNFATIIAAIAEGRRQYTNIQKFVHFLFSHSVGEVSAVLLNIICGGPLILLPIQILWINLATDGVTALALSVERPEKNIMSTPPRNLSAPLITRRALMILSGLGLYAGVETLLLFNYFLPTSHALASTIAFTTIVMTAQVLALNFRHLNGPLNAIGWFSNPALILAILAMIGMQMAAIYIPMLQKVLHTVPLSLLHWEFIFLASCPLFIIPELYKFIRGKVESTQ